MKLVIDTNRIMAGLLKDSTSRKIILHDSFSFFAPDYTETELSKHRPYLMKKAKIPGRILICSCIPCLTASSWFLLKILSTSTIMRCGSWRRLMKTILPFLAVGLALGIGSIWTDDRHFLRAGSFKVCSTRDLNEMI